MNENMEKDINIPGIIPEMGIKNSGSIDVLIELFGDVYKIIDDRCKTIESCIETKDIKNYTTLVHALKTNCRMIGAMDLGEDFFTLEKLGKEENLEKIMELTPGVLAAFKDLKPYLEQYLPQKEASGSACSSDELASSLKQLISSIDDFDLGASENIIKRLSSYEFDEPLSSEIKELEKLVSGLDYDEAKELAESILQKI